MRNVSALKCGTENSLLGHQKNRNEHFVFIIDLKKLQNMILILTGGKTWFSENKIIN